MKEHKPNRRQRRAMNRIGDKIAERIMKAKPKIKKNGTGKLNSPDE